MSNASSNIISFQENQVKNPPQWGGGFPLLDHGLCGVAPITWPQEKMPRQTELHGSTQGLEKTVSFVVQTALSVLPADVVKKRLSNTIIYK